MLHSKLVSKQTLCDAAMDFRVDSCKSQPFDIVASKVHKRVLNGLLNYDSKVGFIKVVRAPKAVNVAIAGQDKESKTPRMFQVDLTMAEDRDLRDEEEVTVEYCNAKTEKEGEKSENIAGTALEFDDIPEGTPVWVKWRGKWQAALKSSPQHCREAILKARPTYASKSYLLVFFPRTATFAWADSQTLLPISENPQPLAFGSHDWGRAITSNPNVPRRISILRVGADVLDISDRLHVNAVMEVAQSASMWQGFAQRTAHAETYQELGQLLVDTFEVIVKVYMSEEWLKNRCPEWKCCCLIADKASSIEQLNEELINSVLWDQVQPLWDDPKQPNLGGDWSTWKDPWTRAYSKWKSTAITHERGEFKTTSGRRKSGHCSGMKGKEENWETGWQGALGGKAGTSSVRGRIQDFARRSYMNGRELANGLLTLPNWENSLESQESVGGEVKLPLESFENKVLILPPQQSSQAHGGSVTEDNSQPVESQTALSQSQNTPSQSQNTPSRSQITPRQIAPSPFHSGNPEGEDVGQAIPDAFAALAQTLSVSTEKTLEERVTYNISTACQGNKAQGGKCSHSAKPGSPFCAKHSWQGKGSDLAIESKREDNMEGNKEDNKALVLFQVPNEEMKPESQVVKRWLPPEERCMGIRTHRLGGGPCPHPRRVGQPFCGRHARYAYRGSKKKGLGGVGGVDVDSEEETPDWDVEENKNKTSWEPDVSFGEREDTENVTTIMTSWQKSRRSAQRRRVGELSGFQSRWQAVDLLNESPIVEASSQEQIPSQEGGGEGVTLDEGTNELPDDERCVSQLTSWKKEGRCPHKRRPGEVFCGFHKRWRAGDRAGDGTLSTPPKKQKLMTESEGKGWENDVGKAWENDVGKAWENEAGGIEDDEVAGSAWCKGEEEGEPDVCIAIRSTRGGGRCTQTRRPGALYCGKHLKKLTRLEGDGKHALGNESRRGRSSLWLWKDLTIPLADELKGKIGEGEGDYEKNLIDNAQEVICKLKEEALKSCKDMFSEPDINGKSDLVTLSGVLDRTEEELSANIPLSEKILEMIELELSRLQPVVNYLEYRAQSRRRRRVGSHFGSGHTESSINHVGSTSEIVTAKPGDSVSRMKELRNAALVAMGLPSLEKESVKEITDEAPTGAGGKSSQNANIRDLKKLMRGEGKQALGENKAPGTRRTRIRCVYCKKRFKKQVFLARHLELKRCEKAPEDKLGGMETDDKVSQVAPIQNEKEGNRSWSCSVCGEKFFLMPDLGRHWKAQHREILMERQAKKIGGQWRRRKAVAHGKDGEGILKSSGNGPVKKENSETGNRLEVEEKVTSAKRPLLLRRDNENHCEINVSEGTLRIASLISPSSRFRAMASLYSSEVGQALNVQPEVKDVSKVENSTGMDRKQSIANGKQVGQSVESGEDENGGLTEGHAVTGANVAPLEMSTDLKKEGGTSGTNFASNSSQKTQVGPTDDEILEAGHRSCCVWRVLQILQEKYDDLPTRVELQALKLRTTVGLVLKPGKCTKCCNMEAGKFSGVKSEIFPHSFKRENFGKRAARRGGSRSKRCRQNVPEEEKDSVVSQRPQENGHRKFCVPQGFPVPDTQLKRPKLEVFRGISGTVQREENCFPLSSSNSGCPSGTIGDGLTSGGFYSAPPGLSGGVLEEKFWDGDQQNEGYLSRRVVGKVVLCDDLSGGAEPVPIPCVVDNDVVEPCSCDTCRDSGGRLDISDNLKPADGFTYVIKRRLDPGLGVDPRNSQLGCQCIGNHCSPATCEHVALFREDNLDACDINGLPIVGRFPYDSKGRIILQENYLVYECNSQCKCGDACVNRVLQRGVKVHLEVFRTHHKGWAVRTAQAIPRGTFICEYIGEVINDKEATKRGLKYDQVGLSYLYDIDAHIDASALQRGVRPFVIDATTVGNVARFINHSCSPNLVNYQVLVESMDYQLAHIGLYAARDIWPGEELAYDYRYKLLPGKGCPCHCGAPSCRGRLY